MRSGPNSSIQPANELRVLDREAADDNAGHAAIEHARNLVARAKAAADLQPERALIGRAHAISSCWTGCLARGAIEIDDVRPFGARVGESSQRVPRVVPNRRSIFEPPLLQPHDPAAHQVHGGIDDHARKLSRNRAAGSPERSGWNCAPSQFSCRTAAAISRP